MRTAMLGCTNVISHDEELQPRHHDQRPENSSSPYTIMLLGMCNNCVKKKSALSKRNRLRKGANIRFPTKVIGENGRPQQSKMGSESNVMKS
jgi:hypothetical protein